LEQRAVYNAINFDLNILEQANATVNAVGITTLWCPSDPTVFASNTISAEDAYWYGPLTLSYTSYCCNLGPWVVLGVGPDQNLGVFVPYSSFYERSAVRFESSAVRFAQIADGLSQTILFGERAHGLLDPTEVRWWNWWAHSDLDTLFDTWFGINPHHRFSGDLLRGWAAIYSASSFHPGGANFAFCDGSVRFLKETIETWRVDPVTGDTGANFDWDNLRMVFKPGTRFGVYQALSTRNGGEVISADAY
jgi:prepilin-type processing-associated H-X9-DG protein